MRSLDFKFGVGAVRAVVGFIVAPISPAIILGFFPLIDGRPGEFWWGIGLAAKVGYPVAIVAGIPIFLFFGSRGWFGFHHYFTAGLILGAVIYTAFFPLPYLLTRQFDRAVELLSSPWLALCLGCVTIATSCFWLIVRPQPNS